MTKKQREILQKMADGCHLYWSAGIRCASSTWLRPPKAYELGERVREGTLHILSKNGWIEMYSDPGWAWRNRDYRLSEKGREVLAADGARREGSKR